MCNYIYMCISLGSETFDSCNVRRVNPLTHTLPNTMFWQSKGKEKFFLSISFCASVWDYVNNRVVQQYICRHHKKHNTSKQLESIQICTLKQIHTHANALSVLFCMLIRRWLSDVEILVLDQWNLRYNQVQHILINLINKNGLNNTQSISIITWGEYVELC